MNYGTGYPNPYRQAVGTGAELRHYVRDPEPRTDSARSAPKYVVLDNGVRLPFALVLRLPALRRRLRIMAG